MIEKVPEEWIQVTAELNRIGDMFDSNIFNSLEQVAADLLSSSLHSSCNSTLFIMFLYTPTMVVFFRFELLARIVLRYTTTKAVS